MNSLPIARIKPLSLSYVDFLATSKQMTCFFLVDIGELEDELIDRYDCMDLEERKEFVKEVQLEKVKQNFAKRKQYCFYVWYNIAKII